MEIQINNNEYTILVVDDISSNVLLLKILLSKEHYNVITAGGGKEAIAITEKDKPDLILLDVMMPDLNGYEVAECLKNNPETKNIPIIFLTALNSSVDVVKGFQVGGFDFISKPFNKDELIIRVSHQIYMVAARRILIYQAEELRRTIAGRDKMYSVIAHDLRSPIGSIKMILNMLIMNLSSVQMSKEMFELLEKANQMTEELFALLDNLLKWTKSQIGRLKVVYQDFDLTPCVKDIVAVSASFSGAKNIKINYVGIEEPVMVHADIDMLQTVLRNLLSNAVKYSYENGSIEVSIRRESDNAVVDVADHGCGIDEDNQGKLFHVDSHYTTYGTKNEEGSGLGLLLCLDFAEKNGSKLWFKSKKDVGSTFSFSVPIVKEE